MEQIKTSKAYVLDNGQVIGEDKLTMHAIKAKSKQLPPDAFTESYGPNSVIEPLYNLEALALLLEENTYHYRACKTKARDTAGLGWQLVPRNGIKNPGQARQKKLVEEFLINNGTHPNSPVEDLTDVLNRMMVDYEATGNGYLEVIRDSVNDAIIGFTHIPSHTIRRHADQVRYVQQRGAKKRWFKAIGMAEDVNNFTGEITKQGSIKDVDERANEIIHFYNYTSRSDYYGIPDVLPALKALLLDKEAVEYNIDFFENNAMPAYAVTIVGADMDEKMQSTIRDYFQNQVKKSRQSTLVITAQRDPNDMSSKPVEIKFEKLDNDVKEESFRLLRQDNRDEILSAHGVPSYRAGLTIVGSLGGSTAVESTEIYKQSVIEPRQAMIENIFNIYVLPAFGVTDYVFKFNAIDTTDKQKEIDNAVKLFNAGLVTPNEARQMIGYEVSNDKAMDDYYISGATINKLTNNTGTSLQTMTITNE